MRRLDGQICVVTGSSSGIGRAVAVALAGHGARVWALGRNRERLDALVGEVEKSSSPGVVVPLMADLEQDTEIESALREILATSDRVDVIVHSAGAIELGTFESVTAAGFDRLYYVNLRAPFVVTQGLLSAVKRARGQIVFVNSSAALGASLSNALYAATKHGLTAIANALRNEVNPDGVRVISVYVGRTATPMQESVHEHEHRLYRPEFLLRPEEVADVVVTALTVPTGGEVTDVHIRPMRKLPPP